MRLSVNDLQCWQRYRDNEDVTLADCLRQLRREEPPTPVLLAGRALHKALEHAQYHEDNLNPFGQSVLQYEGYTFIFQCDAEITVPDVRELKGETVIDTRYGSLTMVGVVDSIDTAISDYKLTGHFDAERLAASYQWRCYLQMFDRLRFDYKVFVAQEIKPNEWAIRDYHEVSFYRYPGMEEDIERAVNECVAFMREHVWAKAA